MAFLDKLGGIAKNIGDKASDSMQTTKLNGKIKSEKAAITELQQKIGEYYYQQHAAGQAGDPGAAEWLAAIDGHKAAIAELQAEIARIQADPEPEPAPAPAPAPAPEPALGRFCTACGAQVAPGLKFCGSCGAQMES